MGRRPRRNHSPAFKAKTAVSAIKGEKTLIGLAQEFDGNGPIDTALRRGFDCSGRFSGKLM